MILHPPHHIQWVDMVTRDKTQGIGFVWLPIKKVLELDKKPNINIIKKYGIFIPPTKDKQ